MARVRIVAGAAKGRRLAVAARGVRPTSDKTREALFSALEALLLLDAARVLDLFAGTGAVGLEALSRGAGHVTFVEADKFAAQTLSRNIAAVGLAGTSVQRSSVEAFFAAGNAEAPFRLIFADPPYGYGEEALTRMLVDAADAGWLDPNGILVVERSARSPVPQWPDVIEPIKHRRYGEGVLWYGRRK